VNNLIIQAGISECDRFGHITGLAASTGFSYEKVYHYGCFPSQNKARKECKSYFFMNLKLLEVATLTGLLTVIRLI